MNSLKTLIVDDNADFRRRIREILAQAPDIVVVGEAADGHEAIRKARQLQPNLVLMDIRMPGMNGIDASRIIKRQMPETLVIILSKYDVKQYREAAKASGASGYLVKRSVVGALLPAIIEATIEGKIDLSRMPI
jgi:DNA-binding NarL/FixJ family response regulator